MPAAREGLSESLSRGTNAAACHCAAGRAGAGVPVGWGWDS